MKQSKEIKEQKDSKLLSNIALVVFFLSYFLYALTCIFHPDYSIKDLIEPSLIIEDAVLINRYIGLGLAIYSYVKYKNKYSLIVMILCIILQIISIIALIYWNVTVDCDIEG